MAEYVLHCGAPCPSLPHLKHPFPVNCLARAVHFSFCSCVRGGLGVLSPVFVFVCVLCSVILISVGLSCLLNVVVLLYGVSFVLSLVLL